MSHQEILDRAENVDIGLSFSGKMSREQVMARLIDAQRLVLSAAPVLMSDKCKFNGDELLGKRRKIIIKFETNYCSGSKTWSLLASCGDIGYGMGWLECRPTKKQVRKFKQKAHKAIKPYSHGGEL